MRLIIRHHTSISFMAGLLFVISLFSLAGCAAGQNARLPEPSALAAPGGADLSDLAEGRALYMTECATCHARVWPDEHTRAEWTDILARHESRLPVGREGYRNIVRYLLEASGPH